jgi:ribosomal protein L7/L12
MESMAGPLITLVMVAMVGGLVLAVGVALRSITHKPPQPVDLDWDATQDADFQDALARGNKIEAIKIYREKTGLGLKESKDAVEYYVAGGEATKKRRRIPDTDSAAGVRDLLEEGRKDEAIELYAKFAGVDQYTAEDAVEQIEREMRLGDDTKDAEGLTASDRDEIHQLLERGNKIEAIKIYRDRTGLGLKESKDVIDEMERGMKL